MTEAGNPNIQAQLIQQIQAKLIGKRLTGFFANPPELGFILQFEDADEAKGNLIIGATITAEIGRSRAQIGNALTLTLTEFIK